VASVIPLIRFNGGEISPYFYGLTDLDTYYASCKYMNNFIPTMYGAAKRRSGLRFVNQCKYSDRFTRLIPFVFSIEQAYALEFGDHYIRVHYNGGTVLKNGVIYEIVSPFPAEDLPQVQYVQSADYLFLVHPKHPPRQLTRTAHDNWQISLISFIPSANATSAPTAVFHPKDGTVTTQTTYTYAATVVDRYEMESAISPAVSVDATYILTWENYVTITYNNVFNMDYIKIYRLVNGFWCYVGRAKPSGSNSVFVDNGTYTPDASHNPPQYINTFHSSGNYPRSVTFYDNRLVFGGTDLKPNWIWGSYINNYRNFATYVTPTSVTPYEYPLTSDQVNIINWMRSASRLLVGTSGAEWRLSDLRANQPYDAKRSTSIGSRPVQALGVNENTLFMGRVGRAIYSFAFNYQKNDFVSQNLCAFAEHLFRRRQTIDWAYSASPDSIIWCVCDDGLLTGMVYSPGQEVVAWSRFITRGKFKSICSIPGDTQDDTYFIVERTINGQVQQYIEIIDEEFNEDITNAFFVDSGVTQTSETAVNIMRGLDHLNGETVDVLADGTVHPSVQVISGSITLMYPAKKIHAGLGFISELETMEIEGGAQDKGTSQSRVRRASKIEVRFEQTVGGCIGTDRDNMTIVPMRNSSIPFGVPVPPYDGFKEVSPEGGFEDSLTVIVMQTQPLPMTVTGIYPRIGSHGR